MKSAIAKRSVVLDHHKTSISLEDEFWNGVKSIADRKKIKLTELLAQIDGERNNANLSSAIRVFVLNEARAQAGIEPPPPQSVGGALPKWTVEAEPVNGHGARLVAFDTHPDPAVARRLNPDAHFAHRVVRVAEPGELKIDRAVFHRPHDPRAKIVAVGTLRDVEQVLPQRDKFGARQSGFGRAVKSHNALAVELDDAEWQCVEIRLAGLLGLHGDIRCIEINAGFRHGPFSLPSFSRDFFVI